MGFWKSLGKGLLKVAPYAALAIPGVGPLAMAGIQAGIGAANAKASGAGWKGTLAGAGLGAATSAIPVKGIGPSANVASKAAGEVGKDYVKQSVADVAKKVGGSSVKSTLGNVLKQTGKNVLTGMTQQNPQGKTDWGATVKDAVGRYGPAIAGAIASRNSGSRVPTSPTATTTMTGSSSPRGGELMRGLGPTMGQRNQNFPNLAESIGAGRQTAMRDQPFRGGYDVKTVTGYEEDDINKPIITTSRMPKISGYQMSLSRDKRKRQSAES